MPVLPMIKMENCKDGYLYVIDARNSNLGIYNKEELGFVISRHKFSANYLFTEYHWDLGDVQPEMECCGTAKPMKEMGMAPAGMNDEEKLKYLNEQIELLKDEINSYECSEP